MPTAARPVSLLVVSDLWPPHVIGGYEMGARDVVARLVARGHRATVLTSTHGVPGPCREGDVHRLLYEEVYPRPLRLRHLVRETGRSLVALRRARAFLRRASFDLVYLYNPLGLSAAVVEDLCRTGRPLVAYVSDDWVTRWPATDPLLERWMEWDDGWPAARRALVRLARVALRAACALPRDLTSVPIRHAQFVSRHIEGISAGRMTLATREVIPWGIDLTRFRFRERRPEELGKWIFVGQLERHKGPQVAIDAVDILRRRGRAVSLALYGRDSTPFARELRARVERAGLSAWVHFAGPRPRERLWDEAYDGGGLLVFATLWEEPFSLTLLEAFASGLPVLTTVTGGTGELVRDGENATAYRTGDAEDLAARYEALVEAPERTAAMAGRARRLVEESADIERMVDRVEAHLLRVCEGTG